MGILFDVLSWWDVFEHLKVWRFELLKGIGEDLSSWIVLSWCSGLTLGVILYIIYYTYTYTYTIIIIYYIIHYYYYILSYTILFYILLLFPSSSQSFSQSSIFLFSCSSPLFPHHLIHSIRVGTYIYLFIFLPIIFTSNPLFLSPLLISFPYQTSQS